MALTTTGSVLLLLLCTLLSSYMVTAQLLPAVDEEFDAVIATELPAHVFELLTQQGYLIPTDQQTQARRRSALRSRFLAERFDAFRLARSRVSVLPLLNDALASELRAPNGTCGGSPTSDRWTTSPRTQFGDIEYRPIAAATNLPLKVTLLGSSWVFGTVLSSIINQPNSTILAYANVYEGLSPEFIRLLLLPSPSTVTTSFAATNALNTISGVKEALFGAPSLPRLAPNQPRVKRKLAPMWTRLLHACLTSTNFHIRSRPAAPQALRDLQPLQHTL